jgi:flagellar hook-associated protein 1 FlgK
MATLSDILNIATSGLHVAQTGLNVVSNNIANVNTAGYVTEVANQASVSGNGVGDGVTTTSITRATNTYLEQTNYAAQSTAAQASITASLLSQAQTLLGDPTPTGSSSGSTATNSFFNSLDTVFSSLTTVAASPSSSSELAAVNQVSTFLSNAQTVQSGLKTLTSQSDQQISTDVSTANQLLSQIATLNASISQTSVAGQDPTSAQNQQASLINQLSTLVGVNVSTGSNGVVTIRGSDGTLLANGTSSATLSYSVTGGVGSISVTPAESKISTTAQVSSGQLGGLLNVRNVQIPGVASQVAQLVNQATSQLNAVANSYSSVPAPTSLSGAKTGQSLDADLTGFTGQTTVGVVNSSGVLQNQATITFDSNGDGGGAVTDGTNTYSFTDGNSFLSSLNSALGSSATASFSNGALSISATGTNGVAVADSASSPTAKAGQTFSTFFGLNNLIQSNTVTNTNTGLTASSQSGFPTGQTISFALTSASGQPLNTITVTTPTGSTVADLLSALNSSSTGVGAYGAFSLSSTGKLSFTANSGSGVNLAVTSDNTANTATQTSLSALFGLGAAQQISTSNSYSIRSDIADNPSLLQTATATLSTGVGTTVLAPGDVSGADALSQAGDTSLSFSAAGGLSAATSTLNNYAAQVAGSIANTSSEASSAASTASSLATEAQSRLSGAEGVNLDSELVSLTTYQQAYNASARLIQASSDLFNTLLTMTGS